MNAISKCLMALALLSGAAYGQVPATNDTSDKYSNTGMGTGALSSITPSGACTGQSDGGCNTAAGWWALHWNTTGEENTAVGTSALLQNTTASFSVAVGV